MHPKAQRTSRPCPAGLGRALERQRVLLGLAALAFAACAGAQLTGKRCATAEAQCARTAAAACAAAVPSSRPDAC